MQHEQFSYKQVLKIYKKVLKFYIYVQVEPNIIIWLQNRWLSWHICTINSPTHWQIPRPASKIQGRDRDYSVALQDEWDFWNKSQAYGKISAMLGQ